MNVNSETFCNFIGNEGKGFSLLHINARSLAKNYDTMYNFLTDINYSFSIIAVSETWVSDNEVKSLYNIPGYNFVCKGRDSRRGGGVGLYLKDGMNYSVRNDFENTQHCESLFIEVNMPTKRIPSLVLFTALLMVTLAILMMSYRLF